MRMPSEIFKLAVVSGIYKKQNKFMCHAIDCMYQRKMITQAEFEACGKAIHEYINSREHTMRSALCEYICINSYEARVLAEQIYLDWDNRPILPTEE